MKQVVVIHGGDSFKTHEDYIQFLKEKEVTLDYFKKSPGWKGSLQADLGSEYEVLQPQMPCKQNAKYLEWRIWFEKLIPFLNDGVILVGHSLGASFLTRYLSEQTFPKKISATLLIAGAYSLEVEEMSEEFIAPNSLTLFEKQGGKIFLYHSKDDPVVPFSELAKYQSALPGATARIFDDRQHFNQETFPELVADITSL